MRELYYYPLCAFGRQIRLYLSEKSLECARITELPWERRSNFSDLQFLSDLPTLVELDKHVYEGWYAIIEYLEQSYRASTLFGSSNKERAETRRIITLFNQMFFAEVTYPIVFERVLKRYILHSSPDSTAVRRGSESLKRYFEYIAWLSEHRNWLAGTDFSFADIVAASHISCLDYLDVIKWENYPIVKDWYVRIKSRPSFREILQDRITNVSPPKHYMQLDF